MLDGEHQERRRPAGRGARHAEVVAALALALALLACGRTHFELDANDASNDDASPAAQNNFAFVTSTTQAPLTYGTDLAGADALCNARATAGGLPGHYVAYLSSGDIVARDRLGSARGWVRVDGKPFLDRVGDLSEGKILHPLSIDELGGSVGTVAVHTGSRGDGTRSGDECSDFTATNGMVTLGTTSGTKDQWSEAGTGNCTNPQHLYCFGVDFSNPLVITPVAGRHMFVTVQPLAPDAGGLATADALCNSEAAIAGVPGNYKALLATDTATALSRLTLSGPPWVRLDGIPLVANPLDLGVGKLLTTPNVTSAQTYVASAVLTGATSPSSTGALSETCTNWTMTGPTAVVGNPNSVVEFFNIGPQPVCTLKYYCFED